MNRKDELVCVCACACWCVCTRGEKIAKEDLSDDDDAETTTCTNKACVSLPLPVFHLRVFSCERGVHMRGCACVNACVCACECVYVCACVRVRV